VSLQQFLDSTERGPLSLVVVNREAVDPIQDLLEELFNYQPVDVSEAETPDDQTDMVYLVEDETVIATSRLEELKQTILLVNSDLYVTGSRTPVELELPAVLRELERVPFTLRGYPDSNKEKLLLITISRYIEGLALTSDGGTHRASFQQLSRINDERGTRRVYRQLTRSPVDTHVYGVPDWDGAAEFDGTVHEGQSCEYRDSWFVTFIPTDHDQSHAALVALETEPRVWNGFWTFDPEEVIEIDAYIEQGL
jgi:hypothetical protein